MKKEFIEASCAWEVYKPLAVHNARLVDLVADRLDISTGEANSKLMARVSVPKRKASGTSSMMVAYRYLKRTVSHFYEGLGRAAIKAFLASVKESTGMGREVAVRGSRTRKMIELSSDEAAFLLTDDRFCNELYGHVALLAGAKSMFASLNAGHLFTETVPETQASIVVCLFAQFALVITKVREYLKLRTGMGGPAALTDSPGVNEGHRDPWVREMASLDLAMWRTTPARRGLRLVDAANCNRASARSPRAGPGGAASAGAGGGASGAAAGGGGPSADGGGVGSGGDTLATAIAAGAVMEQVD